MNKISNLRSLRGEYKKLYKKVNRKLRQDVAPGTERGNAISDVADMLNTAQEENTSLLDLLPDGFEPFYRSLLEALPALTAKDKWVYKHRISRRVFGAICAIVTAIMIITQLGYLAGHFRGIEYIADWLFYAVNATGLLFAGIAIILLFPKKRVIVWALAAFVVLFGANAALYLWSGFKTESIITLSPHNENLLILKRDKSTGAVWVSDRTMLLFASFRNQFPYTVGPSIKTQWLTPDICAITYTDPDGMVHQYVATYGNRGGGISYYYVTSALQGDWVYKSQSTVGGDIKFDSTGVTLTIGQSQEHYAPSDCVQAGTTALVLCKDGLPQWTIAMDQNCKVEGGVLTSNNSTIELCQVSMSETAPRIFQNTMPPNSTPVPTTNSQQIGSDFVKKMSDTLASDPSLTDFQSMQDFVKVDTNSDDMFNVAVLAYKENTKLFSVNGVDVNIQINEIDILAGNANDFLAEIKSTQISTTKNGNTATADMDCQYRIMQGKGVYLAARVGFGVNGMSGLTALQTPDQLLTSGNLDYHFVVPGDGQ